MLKELKKLRDERETVRAKLAGLSEMRQNAKAGAYRGPASPYSVQDEAQLRERLVVLEKLLNDAGA